MSQVVTGDDIAEFAGYLRTCTDRQVQGVYDKEHRAGRSAYAELAVMEARRRGIEIERGEDWS